MSDRLIRALAAGALLLAPTALQAQTGGEATANWAAIVNCAERTGAQARHDCIDRILRDKGVLDRQRELSDQRKAFGQDRRTEERASTSQIPAPSASVQTVIPRVTAPLPTEPPKITAIQTRIVSTRLMANRMLVLTTEEGAMWRQIESTELRLPPKRGDVLKIEEGALGSHHCLLGSKVFRCQRVN